MVNALNLFFTQNGQGIFWYESDPIYTYSLRVASSEYNFFELTRKFSATKTFTNSTTTTLEATTANGKMVFDVLNGRVTVTFSATETNILPSRYIYDLVLTSGATVTRILEGKFIVTPGVTV